MQQDRQLPCHGDLSTDALAHRQERAYGLLQTGLINNEFFRPAAEDMTAGLADAQAQIFQPADPPPLSWSTLIVSKGGSNNGYQETSSGRDRYKIAPG